MKKIFFLILSLLPMAASADQSGKCGANVEYTYNSSVKSLTISGTGDMYDYDIYGTLSELPPFPSLAETLIIEPGVTSIGLFAFAGMTQLTSVKIPNTISTISKYSFKGCISVNSISSDIKNPNSVTMGYGVFDDIPSTAKLTVPMGTKNRYSSANNWNRFTNIVEANIASGACGADVTYFYERTTYTLHISGSGSMWDLDDPAYYPWDLYRSEIKNVKIDSKVTGIGDYAFFGCSGLITAFIPSSVSSIGMYAFSGCSKLETVTSEITTPNDIDDQNIFDGIPSDAKLIVPYGYKKIYQSSDAWKKFTDIVEQETKSGKCGEHVNYLFKSTDYSLSIYGMGDMYSYDISGPSSGFPPFPSSAKTLDISPSVTSIGSFAFYGFSDLISAVIPQTVTRIQARAFCNCSSLECVLSEIVEPFDISSGVFDGIPSTAILLVPKGTKAKYEARTGWNRFNIIESEFEVDGISYKRSVDNSVSVVARDEKYAGKVVIPRQVTYEGKTYIVTHVSSAAFKDCPDLTSVYLPEGLTEMGSMMFSGCTSLTCFNIPNSVSYIETGFTRGSNLEKVVIGSGIKKLVQLAIGRKLSTLAVLATTPPDFDVDQFPVDFMYVPKGCINAYKNKWSGGPEIDIMEIVEGDVNLDGEADENDLDALVSYIVGGYPDCFFVDLADLNGDNKVDIIDMVKLIDIIKN